MSRIAASAAQDEIVLAPSALPALDAASGSAAVVASAPTPEAAVALETEIRAREPRNLLVMGAFEVMVRIGWIFKTESVIMPAFVDAVSGAGWLRGMLPVLGRFGQSVPPVYFAQYLKKMPCKKWALGGWSLAMSLPFFALAGACLYFGGALPNWMPYFFLVMYALFSVFHGVNQLSYGTVQGKLIRITRRGRLLASSTMVGSILSIGFAVWLLGGWLERPDGFGYIFGFTAVAFALASALVWLIYEPRDEPPGTVAPIRQRRFRASWQVIRNDRNFRPLIAFAALASVPPMLFPHYEALARDELGLSGAHLMTWVVTQNAATGAFGLLLGSMADRLGNRLSMRLAAFMTILAPLGAVAFAQLEPELGRHLFWLVFIPLGMNPIMLKTTVNYTLEIAPRSEHPRYLSALSLCLAVPFVLSPVVGWLIDATSFELVMLAGAALIALCGASTFLLHEPRHAAFRTWSEVAEIP